MAVGVDGVCVGKAALGLLIYYLEMYLMPFFFQCGFCYRPATELFEAYSMREMTFNPPVASVTPRRKVLSISLCPFLTT